MEQTIELKNVTRGIELNNNIDVALNKSQRTFTNLTHDVVSKGADYVIRAMPVNDHIKNILMDVKKSFETKDFKQVLKTAVSSSINEGLNLLNIPRNVIRDITKVKDIAMKGGLREGISAAIDIVTHKYLKNNIFSNLIKDFINKTKDFIFSKQFQTKIDSGIQNILDKVEKYKEKCNKWFEYYNKLDFENMNSLAKTLNVERRKVSNDLDCLKQNSIIQNMNQLVNVKKDKLSKIQLQICSNL